MRCRRWATAVALLALASSTGCGLLPGTPEKMEVPAYFGDHDEVDEVRRIMVLPFLAVPGVEGDTDPVREAFIGALAKVQRFEIVPLPEDAGDHDDLYHGLRRGRVPTQILSDLGERYKLDGVLLGLVTVYRPYKPPQIGLRVRLISLHSAEAVWAAETMYDAADANTVEDLRHFASSYMAPEESLHGWEMLLISPSRFTAFVCHRICGTWKDADF